ncbi:hypothetical protein BG011_003999 [Mortierella polycephala]|uniref:Subtilisin-like protein n=1 Tax=Mortierella polycephala TaxID=41804 RepID=A0A9P6Q2R9_9FUNG|nr:hypothetical protein BG011_003999 [Mortierella polycephala]
MKINTILSALAAATLVSAGKFHELSTPETTRVVSGGYIVEYHDGIGHNNAHNTLKAKNVDFKIRKQYGIFNGAAISVHSSHSGKDLASMPGVKNVWPITLHSLPKTSKGGKNPTGSVASSLHAMTGVDIVHEKLKLTGKGIKVGVLDSGIDYKHPAFAAKGATEGCFGRWGKNCRVRYGWDFVGDAYDGSSTPEPDSDPMDCEGHGTHVAGIIGANASNIKTESRPPQPFVGVAPEVTLGSYRIFGCDGQSGDDVIMSAMEMAFTDGMDIINMSLGDGSAFKSNPQAVLGDKLVAHGMALIAAAGNDGSQGIWMVSDTGLGDLSSSVASVDNIYASYYTFTYAGVTHPYGSSQAWAVPISLPSSTTLMVILEKDGSLSDGCDPEIYNGINVKGKIVLALGDITRCKSSGRGAFAKKAGAAGMLIQTLPYGIGGLVGNADFPMGSIENRAGLDLLKAYKKNPKSTFTWSKKPSTVRIEGGGAPSDFSSLGLDGELRSKPDISAPGGNILSTYPLAKNGYFVQSGTSMATPYVAGAHALYMQAKGTKAHGDEIRKVFKNTATITKNHGSKTSASVAKQGGGLINVFNALKTTSSISPDHIDLLDTKNLRKTVKITIKNSGKKAETYTLSHIPADALNSYPNKNSFPLNTPLIEADYATVSFSQTKVKIPAGKSAKITLRFKEPKTGSAAHFPIYSGFVIATPMSKGSVPVQVPYTGLKGDVSKVPIMDTDLGFPALKLSNSTADINDIPSEDFVFDMEENNPVILTRVGSHTPNLTIRVFDAKKKFVGFMVNYNTERAIGESGRQTDIDEEGNLSHLKWYWTGRVVPAADAISSVRLPSGTYNIVVASQRKLTKGNYPADYEVFDLGKVRF